MDVAAHLDRLATHGAALGDAAERAGLAAPVPTCPSWDVRALLAHVGTVHRWAATHVREGRAAFDGNTREPDFPAPPDGVVAWYRRGLADLLDALRSAPDDLDALVFLAGDLPPRAFWARRQAHETAVHGADAAAALGRIPTIERAFALDGIGELLEGFYGRPGGRLRADPPVTLAVRPTDAPVSWTLRIAPDGRTVVRGEPAAADCTLSGAAADLYLDLWNRTPAGAVTVAGDRAVLELWRSAARVRWS